MTTKEEGALKTKKIVGTTEVKCSIPFDKIIAYGEHKTDHGKKCTKIRLNNGNCVYVRNTSREIKSLIRAYNYNNKTKTKVVDRTLRSRLIKIINRLKNNVKKDDMVDDIVHELNLIAIEL